MTVERHEEKNGRGACPRASLSTPLRCWMGPTGYTALWFRPSTSSRPCRCQPILPGTTATVAKSLPGERLSHLIKRELYFELGSYESIRSLIISHKFATHDHKARVYLLYFLPVNLSHITNNNLQSL